MNKIVVAVLVIVALGAGFFGGTMWADRDSGDTSTTTAGPGGGVGLDRDAMANMTEDERAALMQENGGAFPGGGMGRDGGELGGLRGMGATVGTIVDVGTDSITVELDEDGGSMTVYYSDTTLFAEEGTGMADSLAEGAHVTLSTSPATDGVFTANSIIVSAE